MTENNITLHEISELLKSKNKIIIISHVRPDGDTLACAYALKHILNGMGKTVLCTASDRASARLAFLCDDKLYLPNEIPENFNPDLVVSVDVASNSMLGNCTDIVKKAVSLKIDHHYGNDNFADYTYNIPHSASCSEIIYDLIKIMTDEMPFRVCELLYAGISFDTGCFKHSNVTSGTHDKASYLVSRGVNTSLINEKLFGNKTQKEITALKLAYNSLEYYADGKIAICCITNEMKKQYNIDDDDVADLAQIPIEIDGVVLGITIKEKSDVPHNFKVSMRSKPGVDAGCICKKIDGGGHICAAGGLIIADNGENAVKKALEVSLPYIK